MEFEKLQTASLKELFISSVEDKILSGELPIGAQLPTERELAEMMDVSRGVVNSGIAEMAHKGFLEVRPRVGTFVADYRRVGKSDIFLSIMHYNGGILPEQEIRSLLEFKSLIDCFFRAQTHCPRHYGGRGAKAGGFCGPNGRDG